MRKTVSIALAGLAATACATSPETEAGMVHDPYEGWNRNVYAFNEAVDKAALEPAARAYRAITPGFARQGVRNFLSNLNAPVVFVNDVLQGEPDRAGDTFYRFFVNTTVGVVGLWDAAAHFGVEGHSEDFGQTLAVWGAEPGPFLVLPILGPSNPRDLTGTIVDRAFDPFTWIQFEDEDLDTQIAVGRGVLGALSARESLIEAFETLREQPEPYIAYRRAYMAQREAAIRNGREEEDPYQDLPDFDAFDDFDDFEDEAEVFEDEDIGGEDGR